MIYTVKEKDIPGLGVLEVCPQPVYLCDIDRKDRGGSLGKPCRREESERMLDRQEKELSGDSENITC